jgi:predicted nucleic acid-binding protein
MIRAVYDCNIVVSGIGWSGAARKCLELVARRRVFLFVTDPILDEYELVVPKILAEEMPEIDPAPKLAWLKSKAGIVEPALLGKRRSRDAKDDIYLAAAMATPIAN